VKPVAVIDIGSNTLKNLVARSDAKGRLHTLYQQTEEIRLSRNMDSNLALSEFAMNEACAGVQTLLKATQLYAPAQTIAVATSAVRDASNADVFLRKIQAACGLSVRVLTGEEEASLTARGVATDPVIAQLAQFNLTDLGGGSLECVRVQDKAVTRAESFPLGAVRLTRAFIEPPEDKPPEDLRARVRQRVQACLKDFCFAHGPLVGTGGAFNAARAILFPGTDFSQAGELDAHALEGLCAQMCALSLAERCQSFPRLSPARADIMPAALCVILEMMQLAEVESVVTTLRNLRYGIADAFLRGEWTTL